MYDGKSLHRALANVFRNDELKRIPLLRRGQRLEQGATYYDLCEGREFTALGTQVVGRDDCVVAKAEVGYDIWNRLRTLRVAPVDQDTGPMCDAVVLACTNCGVPIVDPVVQVVHNDRVFCCPNCAEAMEQTGSGAYPSTVKREEFGRRKPRIEPEVLGKKPDLPPHFNAPGRRSQNKRFAARRFHKAEKHLDRCAFSRAIRTEEAENFPSAHR